jgi:hypothetical protein
LPRLCVPEWGSRRRRDPLSARGRLA